MKDLENEQFIRVLEDNYHRVFNYTGGQDLQLMHSLACKYTLCNKQFSGVMLQKIIEQVTENNQSAVPIKLDYKNQYKLAFYFLLQGDIDEAIYRLIENDQILGEAKFKSSQHRMLAALFLQQGNVEHAQRARQLYVEMNKKQRLLTGKEDIPYVVFLTKNPHFQPEELAEVISYYYQDLRSYHFARGNYLQALAQIMALGGTSVDKLMLQSIVNCKEELMKLGIKVKRRHFPYLGVFALTGITDAKINEIITLNSQLEERKLFKGAKEYALAAAIQKVVQDEIGSQQLVDVASMPHLTDFVDLLELVDFYIDVGPFFPSGISDLTDIFN